MIGQFYKTLNTKLHNGSPCSPPMQASKLEYESYNLQFICK